MDQNNQDQAAQNPTPATTPPIDATQPTATPAPAATPSVDPAAQPAVTTPAQPAATPAPAATDAPKKKSSMTMILIIAVIVLLLIIGGLWFMMKGKSATAPQSMNYNTTPKTATSNSVQQASSTSGNVTDQQLDKDESAVDNSMTKLDSDLNSAAEDPATTPAVQ